MIVILMTILASLGIFMAASGQSIGGPIFAAGLIGAAFADKFS